MIGFRFNLGFWMLKEYFVYLGFVFTVALLLLIVSCVPEETTAPDVNNTGPVIHGFSFTPNDSITVTDTVTVVCNAEDPDADPLSYSWSSLHGELIETVGSEVRWKADSIPGSYPISVTVTDYWYASGGYTDTIHVFSDVSLDKPPQILSFIANRDTVAPLDTVMLFAEFTDEDDNDASLDVEWTYSGGYLISNTRNQMRWIAPIRVGNFMFTIEVSDEHTTVRDTQYVYVAETGSFNNPPEIERVSAGQSRIVVGDTTQVICSATDPDGDPIFFSWSASNGSYSGGGSRVTWTAPGIVTICTLRVEVSDGLMATRGYTTVNVVPDTTIFFESDFSFDDVTNIWNYEGILAGLGDAVPNHQIEWDEVNEKMAVTAQSDYSTSGFRLRQHVFGDGTLKIKFQAPSTQFGMIGFLPKFLGESNYILIGVNFFIQQWTVLRCVNGEIEYLASDWGEFVQDKDYLVSYRQAENEVQIELDGNVLWSGSVAAPFTMATSLGVAVYSLEGSGPAWFDDLRVSDP